MTLDESSFRYFRKLKILRFNCCDNILRLGLRWCDKLDTLEIDNYCGVTSEQLGLLPNIHSLYLTGFSSLELSYLCNVIFIFTCIVQTCLTLNENIISLEKK